MKITDVKTVLLTGPSTNASFLTEARTMGMTINNPDVFYVAFSSRKEG